MRRIALPLLLLGIGLVAAFSWSPDGAPEPTEPGPSVATAATASNPLGGHIWGRVTTETDDVHEGLLRFGGDEEVLWMHQFNGVRTVNPWARMVDLERLPTRRLGVTVFGFELFGRDHPTDLRRPFLARFGELDRIDVAGREVRVTLRGGEVVELDRREADDLADGVTIRKSDGSVVEFGERRIRSIEFLPAPAAARSTPVAAPLHGVVHTADRTFSGLLQWNREQGLVSDVVHGRGPKGEVRLRFDEIRSIHRLDEARIRVTRTDGASLLLEGGRDAEVGHRGVYVDDERYGRVLVSWDAVQRVDFSEGTAPGRDAFSPGAPLVGEVVARDGRRVRGRIVFDLDESDGAVTLDAPADGITWMLPFGRVAAIDLPPDPAVEGARARVTLRSGERLDLELRGDLGEGNAGVLVISPDREVTYLSWPDVGHIRFGSKDAPGPGDADGGTGASS